MERVPTKLSSRREAPSPNVPRARGARLRDACRGLKLGIRGRSSFSVHFFFAALIAAAAIVLRCEFAEWCILAGCVGAALAAELFYSAMQTLIRGMDERTKPRAVPSLDISASAVLVVRIFVGAICALIFLH